MKNRNKKNKNQNKNKNNYKSKNKIIVPTKRCGTIQRKVLLLLLSGVAFGLSRSPKQQWKIITAVPKEFEKMGPNIPRSIRKLYESKLVQRKEHRDGTTTLVLTEKGRKNALTYDIETMRLKKQRKWDNIWRIVMYDVPEKHREGRNALSRTLKQIGMFELQKSVFIYPYECKKEVDFVIESYDLRRYVRYVEAFVIDNEIHIKKAFRMN